MANIEIYKCHLSTFFIFAKMRSEEQTGTQRERERGRERERERERKRERGETDKAMTIGKIANLSNNGCHKITPE